ncbi:hypothetical protein KIPB_008412 [Kipferlia bialata]|uniref:SET domain-containing protein n=1 Tax=Kipferlia bialata TaxID=797122 RepID=A0A9K3CZY8_9EUKA|nr:hypothetical protein KIPB_008412 [Kipferlia bialata]|eukprot:g8412.t1
MSLKYGCRRNERCTAGPINIMPVPGYGRGVVALVPIQKGECVLRERPFLVVPTYRETENTVEAMNAETQRVHTIQAKRVADLSPFHSKMFYSLQDHRTPKGYPRSLHGILSTNSFACEAPFEMAESSCMCVEASMFNHSCAPNLCRYWDKEAGEMVFHTVRDVAAGEQLTINYCRTFDGRKDRQDKLGRYAINCTCPVCSLSDEESAARDAKCARYKDTRKERLGKHAIALGLERLDLAEELCFQEQDSMLDCYKGLMLTCLAFRDTIDT